MDEHGLIFWFTYPGHWSGSDGVQTRLLEHLELSSASLGLAMLIALPIGLLIGHTRRGEFLAISVANLGRAIPSFAILSIVFQLVLGFAPEIAFGFVPTVVALTLLSIPPILTNTSLGIRSVDQDAVEAARGMGMTGNQVLRRLELPLAAPLILAGIRTAAVQIVATATLAALIAGGGLGRYIIDGQAQGRQTKLIAGAVLVAVLAVVTELSFGGLQRLLTPKTSSQGSRALVPAPIPGSKA